MASSFSIDGSALIYFIQIIDGDLATLFAKIAVRATQCTPPKVVHMICYGKKRHNHSKLRSKFMTLFIISVRTLYTDGPDVIKNSALI